MVTSLDTLHTALESQDLLIPAGFLAMERMEGLKKEIWTQRQDLNPGCHPLP